MRKVVVLKKTIYVILFAAFLFGGVILLNKWLCFKDGSICSGDERVKTFQSLPENSVDVLIVGSSHVMCGMNPVIFWEQEGITAYNLATRAQTLPFSYLYLKEALKTQSPRYVIMDAYSVMDEKEQYGLINNEDHFNMNMGSLPFSMGKAELIEKYIPFRERIYYYIPFLRFHSRWKRALEMQPDNPGIFLGFCCGEDETEENVSFEEPYSLGREERAPLEAVDLEYLERIIELCRKEEIPLIFIKTPVNASKEQMGRFNELGDILEKEGIPFVNYMELYRETDFSYREDFRDRTHLNSRGAEKITTHFLEFLKEYDLAQTGGSLKDHRNETGFDFWQQKSEAYHAHQRERGREE